MPLILGTNSIKDTGFNVDNSLRFDDGSSDTLTRDITSNGNKKLVTFSSWIKRSALGTSERIFMGDAGGGSQEWIMFLSNDKIKISSDTGSGYNFDLDTDAVFRDVSAWYHIVWIYDSAQSTSTDRVKLYINNSLQSLTGTYPSQNTDLLHFVSSGSDQDLGGRSQNGDLYFNGYMAETVFIDGQALDPTSFGEFDEDTGIWKPIDVSGLTFGTNGFYLDFENSGSLGADVSGNGNNFTVNNLTSIDQTTDTCTNNFATFNSLISSNSQTFSEGNTQVQTTDSNMSGGYSSFGLSQGKWYAEFKTSAIGTKNRTKIGITSDVSEDDRLDNYSGEASYSHSYDAETGNKVNNANFTSYGNSYAIGDIVGVALDLDNNKLYFSKNGTWQNSGDPTSGATGTGAISITAPSNTSTGFYFFSVGESTTGGNSTIQCNFGNPPYTISSGNSDGNGYGLFEYQPPSGYLSLCTKNLATDG